ncbi:hypothetical protein C8R43DRAFT_961758 [Mycena crocata]|nr:hypothetical protein C8R43DRAFT_961758 [Mycena crocata]
MADWISQYVADMAGGLFTANVPPFPAPDLQRCVLPGFTPTVSSVLSAAIELLAEFDLRFTDVQLMQRATGTIIAASAVTLLLPGVVNFTPNDIDFFARIACGLKIVRFLQMNNYSVDSTHYSYHDHVNVKVIECSSYDPFNTVVKFHSTPVVGWIDEVIWFGYTSMSAAGVTITSSSLTSFCGDLGHFQRICGPPSDPLFTWHLGGTGCGPRSLSTPQPVSTWLRRMHNLLLLEDAPRTLVDVTNPLYPTRSAMRKHWPKAQVNFWRDANDKGDDLDVPGL